MESFCRTVNFLFLYSLILTSILIQYLLISQNDSTFNFPEDKENESESLSLGSYLRLPTIQKNLESKSKDLVTKSALPDLVFESELVDPDLKSALRRVKTTSCKLEIKNFAQKLKNKSVSQPIIKRSCKLDDQSVSRITRIGCSAQTYIKRQVKIEEPILNLSDCLNFCFSYAYSFGGYHLITKSCYCDNNDHILYDHVDCDTKDKEKVEWYRVNNGIFQPKNNQNLQTLPKDPSEVKLKIAFLLTVSGQSALHIRRLLRNIYSKKHLYFIHVDTRNVELFSDLLELETKYYNVIVSRTRFVTIWGAPRLLDCVLSAMQELYASMSKWDYLINLSESDFPIKPLVKLENYLSASREQSYIYMKHHNIQGYNFIKKQGLDRYFYQCEDRAWLVGKRRLPAGIIYSGGSDWLALPREFCSYILDDLKENNNNTHNSVRTLLQYYNHTLLPVESFFHTIALNSEWCDRIIDHNLRITNWNRKHGCKCQHKDVVDWCGCSPLVYRSIDWTKLDRTQLDSNLFFSRKFDPTISSSIIAQVERQLVKVEQPSSDDIKLDTRFWQTIYKSSKNVFARETEEQRVMKIFGLFCIEQMIPGSTSTELHMSSFALQNIELFFKYDRFIGYVYRYCKEQVCIQFLVERNIYIHDSETLDTSCRGVNGSSLYAIEVNHGFDTSERMFRNYLPLNQNSNIAVYHEWLVGNVEPTNSTAPKAQLKFRWSNGKIQRINFKDTTQNSRIILAHRLNSKQLKPGKWNLTITMNDIKCLVYKFLVFSSDSRQMFTQEEFNNHYSIRASCSSYLTRIDTSFNNCLSHDWSLESKNKWTIDHSLK